MRLLLERPALLAVVAVLYALAWAVGPASAGGKDELKIKEGKPAPDVALPATQPELVIPGKKEGEATLKLSDLKGKKNVVLYFFPKALTGG
jgi:hypothetical protein